VLEDEAGSVVADEMDPLFSDVDSTPVSPFDVPSSDLAVSGPHPAHTAATTSRIDNRHKMEKGNPPAFIPMNLATQGQIGKGS
jgi:hypothetical protein